MAVALTPRDRHGGNVYAAARETGVPVRRWTDFSASVNPLGPSPRSLKAIAHAQARVSHYPDPSCLELREDLSQEFGVDRAQLLIGNGSSELISLIPATLCINHALILGPTFSEYERAGRLAGSRVTRILAKPSNDYLPPVDQALAVIRRRISQPGIDAIFLCNPNSPTGCAVPRSELCELLRAARRRGIWAIVDETFVDYSPGRSILKQLDQHSHLIVLRSFTKFYALPGLRVGYLAAAKNTILRFRERQPPWSVNALGQAAARAALEDHSYRSASLALMRKERAYLTHQLGQLPGLKVYSSEANFLMARLPKTHPAAFVASSLRRQRVLVRDLSSVPGLNALMIRFAVRTRRENRLLISALRGTLRKHRA